MPERGPTVDERGSAVSEMVKPGVEAFFEQRTNTVSYLVWDPGSKQSVVIDPVLDFDPRNGRVSVKSADAILAAAVNAGSQDRPRA